MTLPTPVLDGLAASKTSVDNLKLVLEADDARRADATAATAAANAAVVSDLQTKLDAALAKIEELEAAEEPPVDPPTEPPVDPPVDPPATKSVYGPTGKHKFPVPAFAQTHDVAPTWTALASQITACQSHSGACKISLTPGTFPVGKGFTSSSAGVLSGIGSASKLIYVTPRDGWGTVKTTAGAGVAFVGVQGVILDYIDFSQADGVMIRNTTGFKLGHTVVKLFNATANSAGVKDLELVEVIAGIEQVNGISADRMQFKIADTAGFEGLKMIGCYVAPNYKATGDSAHQDGVQWVKTSSTGTFKNSVLEDTVIFQSGDSAFISADTTGGAIKHSAFIGGTYGQIRYPMYSGGDPITLQNALWADWKNVTITDTLVAGSISSALTPTSVTNSKSTKGEKGWALMPTVTAAWLDENMPKPNPTVLFR